MARALLPDSAVLCKTPRCCRLRARASLKRHNPVSARSEGDPCALHAVKWRSRKLNTPRSHAAHKCLAGRTASHEDIQTQATDPSRTHRSVTEEMFQRAERYASAAGPGMGTTCHKCCYMNSALVALAAHQTSCHKPVHIAAGGAGGNPTYAALQGADAAWAKVKAQEVFILDCATAT